MKFGKIFVILSAAYTLGVCSSYPPVNLNLDDAKAEHVQQRDEASLIKINSSSAETPVIHQVNSLRSRTELAIAVLRRASATTMVGFGFYSILSDCRGLPGKENRTTDDIAKCGMGALATVITVATEIRADYAVFYEVLKTTTNTVIDYTVNAALNKFVGGGVSITGPFPRAPHAGLPNRDVDSKYKRVEDHFTSVLGVNVSHIGHWDGSMHEDAHIKAMKREQNQEGTIPVFGLNYMGEDMHFAYGGQNVDGKDIFKIGTGLGPATEENKRRLNNRSIFQYGIPAFGNMYFENGGIDLLATPTADTSGNPNIFPTKPLDRENNYEWIYTQLECIFEAQFLMPLDPLPRNFDAIGLWYQMYDLEEQETLSGGTIAFFGSTTPSIIEDMQPVGDIAVNTFCSR
ncbi:hypothetical protein GLAREA_03192 [Glarea lozoyensis ATCC 20868]|uniref:Aromatic peroxygenase n=2 Tax=Glarea lozoyensis TaxID=101852 RepID=S3CLD8_GLAL2|nr:uncharacterized protein GLAREA_03192 [Glarea lozoyensis ATCC 20868]EHL00274.1 hypothetical protein M7I_3769 [Glarea lozoyensis 74030]EPE27277.1 hypothetical protein GLAREA_03192 [Glarea lozoyensis ATCC 20868]